MADDTHVDINYLKSANFREVACDGTLGGPTPNGKLWIAFYTERYPLPRITRHKVTRLSEGKFLADMPGSQIDGREGIIRNIEFGVYLSHEEAKTLSEWLNSKLKEMEEGPNE